MPHRARRGRGVGKNDDQASGFRARVSTMSVSRIGFIGDVHAEDARLSAAICKLKDAGADVVLCVGDIVDGKGDLERTLSLLQEHGVLTVRGNHERWLLANDMRDVPDAHSRDSLSPQAIAYLKSLPVTMHIDTIAGTLLLCHGLGDDDMATVWPWDSGSLIRENISLGRVLDTRKTPIIVCGHSHRRLVRTIEGHLLINAGTIYREHEPSFGLLDLNFLFVRTWLLDNDLQTKEMTSITILRPNVEPETVR